MTMPRKITITLFLSLSILIFFITLNYSNNIQDDDKTHQIATVTSVQPVINRNTTITIINDYMGCGHQVVEYANNEEYLNMNEETFIQKFPASTMQNFDDKHVSLIQYSITKCDNHFIVKEFLGNLAAFYQNNPDKMYKIINADFNGLRKEDQEKFIKGVEVESLDDLSHLEEDYLS